LFGLNGEQCQELVTSPYLCRLLGLTVPCAVGDDGLRALAACPQLTGLASLTLVGPPARDFHTSYRSWIGDAGANALAASPYLSGLKVLNLRAHAMSAGAAAALRRRFGDRVYL
jgi:hypothetical protein